MRASKTVLLLLLLPALPVFADSKQTAADHPPEDLPDGDLLEFIAEFEPLDGEWIDPIQLNTIFAENRNGKDNEQDHN
mgnify:FL=1|jgi:hypothetical protein